MENHGPIIFIDEDDDDKEMVTSILKQIAPDNQIIYFANGQQMLDYLDNTDEPPFLIISEVFTPLMSGLELLDRLNQFSALKAKSIPFILITSPIDKHLVEEAYKGHVQGIFEKKHSLEEMKRQFQAILDYWTTSLYPNQFAKKE
ncbi:response regulator [Spirosoma sp. HMF4905]|uniref:Response regulator n=1 Tax=Spirosoma arboris TaxID=2682092 RepID=A0A7K1S816_9BACT|nr:response regulator [Spirosoma arboris]MVM29937.1 response regulator [Spirosoma arboris]